MKRFLSGFVVGVILTASVGVLAAQEPIRLLVNGREIKFPDAPPQILNNRVMVPARPLAEALGAKVDWDEKARSVLVTTWQSMGKPVQTGAVQKLKLGEAISYRGMTVAVQSIGSRQRNVRGQEMEVITVDITTAISKDIAKSDIPQNVHIWLILDKPDMSVDSGDIDLPRPVDGLLLPGESYTGSVEFSNWRNLKVLGVGIFFWEYEDTKNLIGTTHEQFHENNVEAIWVYNE